MDDIALAAVLAEVAGEAIRPYFRAAHGVEMKADFSPVTLADRAAEEAMRAVLRQKRPDDGIIGEELADERTGARRIWVLDPIDGTRSFIAGRAIFGTLIALMEDDKPVLGVIDQPIQRERWVGAKGRRTELAGLPTCVRSKTLENAHLASTGPQYFSGDDYESFKHVADQVATVSWGGDCYNYGLLASGHIDIVIEAGLKLHDWAALVPIVEGAGGRMTDWNGEPLTMKSDGRVIAVGNPELLKPIKNLLAC